MLGPWGKTKELYMHTDITKKRKKQDVERNEYRDTQVPKCQTSVYPNIFEDTFQK